MAKRRNSKSRGRRESLRARRARQTQQQRLLAAIGSVLVIAVVGAYFLFRPGVAPQVAQARMELDPVLGNPDAPVSIVEYGAYSCHACQFLHQTGILERIIADYDGAVNFIFRDFPVITPTYDHMAAEVAQCVLDDDQGLFWQFHDRLYTTHYANSTRDELVSLGASLGADRESLASCVENLTHFNTVQYDYNRGQNLAIRGTPTLFINEARVFSLDESTIRGIIDQEFGRAG